MTAAEAAAARLVLAGALPPGAYRQSPSRAVCPPCRFESDGPVVEACPFGNQNRHVRHCLYEGHDFGLCCRGPTRNAAVQSCAACNYWEKRA